MRSGAPKTITLGIRADILKCAGVSQQVATGRCESQSQCIGVAVTSRMRALRTGIDYRLPFAVVAAHDVYATRPETCGAARYRTDGNALEFLHAGLAEQPQSLFARAASQSLEIAPPEEHCASCEWIGHVDHSIARGIKDAPAIIIAKSG